MLEFKNLDAIKYNVYTILQKEPTDLLDLQIETAIEEILAYLYRDDIPCELEKPMSMVIANEIKTSALTNGLEGNITSYSEGDMSISLGGVVGSQTGIRYGGRLDGFKLIRGLKSV